MFDPQRRAASGELRAALKCLIAFLELREAGLGLRKRARREADRKSFGLAVEAIACNLAVLRLTDPSRPLAVPRSSGVMWARCRYSNPVYGQHFVDALDLMAHPKVGLVEVLTSGYRFAGKKQLSTIKPAATFAGHVPPSVICCEAFDRAQEPEVLILKRPRDDSNGNGDTINYRDTAQTRRRRREVLRINETLRNAPLKLVIGDDDGDAISLTEDGQPVDPTRRTVRRIFNNGSWYEGGRLFDGFWETMRREDRFKFLRICTKVELEGERIANVDFSQLFPTLAYHKVGTTPPDGALYDIVGDGSSREGWKTLVNAMLFGKGKMTRWPSGYVAVLSNRDQTSRRLGPRATCSRADRETVRVGRRVQPHADRERDTDPSPRIIRTSADHRAAAS
jgi:hypothetical protein